MTARSGHASFVSPRHTPSVASLSGTANPASPSPSLTGISTTLGSGAQSRDETDRDREKGLPCSRVLMTCAAVFVYSICSVAMILLNKVVTVIYRLQDCAVQMVLLQCAAGAVLAWGLKRSRLVEFPPVDATLLWQWLPVTVLFICMLLTSLLALHTMSLAMYTLLKNGALFLTAMGDVYFFRRDLSADQYLGFMFMFLGSILSAGDDRWMTSAGVFWTVLNILFTAAYNLRLKKVLGDHKEWGGHWAPMYYNNTLSVAILLPLVLWGGFGGFGKYFEVVSQLPSDGLACVAMFIAAGAVLSGASLWCLRVTTPTTYCVVGATCKIPNILLGAIIFDQYPTNRGILGIITAFSGIYLYTWASLQGEPKPAVAPSPTMVSNTNLESSRNRRRSLMYASGTAPPNEPEPNEGAV